MAWEGGEAQGEGSGGLGGRWGCLMAWVGEEVLVVAMGSLVAFIGAG